MYKKNSSDFSADFIIIGSGLGGLITAAYLARAKYRVLVLEKNSEIGGKCATRTINGYRYVIGANGFGSRTASILQNFGINIKWIPASFHIYGKNGSLKFPFTFLSFKELKTFGMNYYSILKMCAKLGKTILLPSLAGKTYRNYIDYLIDEPDAKELLFLEAWYVGSHPDWLSASALKFFMGTFYGFNKPIYPLSGAQAIPIALSDYIKIHGGTVLTKQNVTKIGIENGTAKVVQVGRDWFSAKYAIISNAETAQTLSMLNDKKEIFPIKNNYLSPKSAFSFALLLLSLDANKAPKTIANPNPSLETNSPLLIRPICEIIGELEKGEINNSPVCNLVLSDLKAQLMSGARLTHLPVHVSILWPQKLQKKLNLKSLTQSILIEINKRYPGFADAVTSSQWLTPTDYKKRFDFSSNPAPILETPTYTKQSWKLPVNGLYNVGATVLPSGSHTGTAIESGRLCAKDILNYI
ncbi:MAG: NAD(P)/FAD-dependent oxidoreductase [Spirochaetes bacterium]|nr:NAD(P)/FAD-dependent oxidoreductase [Spirochaetota bacterium]